MSERINSAAAEAVTIVNHAVWTDPVEIASSRLTRPHGTGAGLPVLYLLHGIRDVPEDWWSRKGQLAGILASVRAHPMLIVMVANGGPDHTEPVFADFKTRFDAVVEAVNAQYQPDAARQGLVGVSMGAKQALAILLGDQTNRFSVLGLFSGMFQEGHLAAVHGDLASWPANRGDALRLYFHYCGSGANREKGDPVGSRGDALYFPGNQQACTKLGGTQIRTRDDGMHNWLFWRPELAEFFRAINEVW